jgi:hypothetical protein
MGYQGEIGSVELLRPIVTEEGAIEMENDLSKAKFDVAVDIGPSSASKRDATVRSLMSLLQVTTDPETQQVLQSMIIMNMQGDGIQDVRDFFRKRMVRMGVVEPTEQEAQEMMAEMQNQQPDPNAVFLQAAAEEAVAKAAKARADVVETVAEAEYKRAKTAETLANVDIEAEKASVENARKVQEMVNQSMFRR